MLPRGINGAFQQVRISGNDRTVKTVQGIIMFLLFINHSGIEYPVHFFFNKIENVTVGKLGWKTDVFRHDRGCTLFVKLEVGRGGKSYPKPASGQKSTPERKVFIHVHAAGDAIGENRLTFRFHLLVK